MRKCRLRKSSPPGQASAALQLLGAAASSPGNMSFASYDRATFITANAGQVLDTVGTLSGLLIWSSAAWWMLFSLAMTIHLGIFADGGVKEYSLSAWSPVYPWVRVARLLLLAFSSNEIFRVYCHQEPSNLATR